MIPPDRSRCRDIYLWLVWLMIQVRREMLSKPLMGPCRKGDATEETTSPTSTLRPIPHIWQLDTHSTVMEGNLTVLSLQMGSGTSRWHNGRISVLRNITRCLASPLHWLLPGKEAFMPNLSTGETAAACLLCRLDFFLISIQEVLGKSVCSFFD